MNTSTLVWLAIFAACALCFFAVAAVVSVRGFGDLRELLRFTEGADSGITGAGGRPAPRPEFSESDRRSVR